MRSVQFWIVPCSSLYFFSWSIGPFQWLVNANYRVLISVAPVTSRAVPSSLFILASSVCKSLQRLISALTQGGECGHLFRLTCTVVLWRGMNTANKYHWRVWGVLTVTGPHWVCSHSRRVCAFPVYTAQAPGCSARELSKAGPELCALPRSRVLGFRFLGTPQRLCWACIL